MMIQTISLISGTPHHYLHYSTQPAWTFILFLRVALEWKLSLHRTLSGAQEALLAVSAELQYTPKVDLERWVEYLATNSNLRSIILNPEKKNAFNETKILILNWVWA